MPLCPWKFSKQDALDFLSLKNRSELFSLSNIRNFVTTALQSLDIQILVAGNILPADALRITEMLSSMPREENELSDPLDSEGLLPCVWSGSNRSVRRVVRLPLAECVILTCSPDDPKEPNVCLEVYFQHELYDVGQVALMDLLEQVLYEPFFDELRTKKQVRNVCNSKLRTF